MLYKKFKFNFFPKNSYVVIFPILTKKTLKKNLLITSQVILNKLDLFFKTL